VQGNQKLLRLDSNGCSTCWLFVVFGMTNLAFRGVTIVADEGMES